jgi:hypothetical protein
MSSGVPPNEQIAQELERLERELLDPAVRRDRNRVDALLHDEFLEFGSSGRVWTRSEILDLLVTEGYVPPAMEAFDCRMLAPDLALVTYRTMRADPQTAARRAVNRSSIWVRASGTWRVRFHQGTPVPHE